MAGMCILNSFLEGSRAPLVEKTDLEEVAIFCLSGMN